MGNVDRANVDARKNTPAPKAPDNGAVDRAKLLELDVRERALSLAIKATKQGLLATQCYKDPEETVLAVANGFYKFLTGDSK